MPYQAGYQDHQFPSALNIFSETPYSKISAKEPDILGTCKKRKDAKVRPPQPGHPADVLLERIRVKRGKREKKGK